MKMNKKWIKNEWKMKQKFRNKKDKRKTNENVLTINEKWMKSEWKMNETWMYKLTNTLYLGGAQQGVRWKTVKDFTPISARLGTA